MMATTKLIFLFLLTFGVSNASHFRGGIIQWRPLNAVNFDGNIEITHRMAWRRSWSGNGCTLSDIGTNRLFGLGSLSCQVGCSGTVGTLQFHCTDFDVVEDWTSGELTYTYNIGTSVISFEASFRGNAWIPLQTGGSNWEIRVKGNLARRSDNGHVNSSPVTTTTPIVRLQFGCAHNYRIPVQDADQDVVRCRWAVGNECAGVCSALPGATINSDTCVLSWNAAVSTGWYAVAIQVEDFISSSSTTALSSVPLQFLIFVFGNSQSCPTGDSRPSLVAGETPPDSSCIPVSFGTTYTAGLVADSGGSTASIVRFITVSPFGLRTSSVVQSPFNSQHYYVNVTWTPMTSQYGLHQFCFRAVSSIGFESNQSCITLLGGVTGPVAQANSVSPRGRFTPTASTQWSITFDQSISRPSSSRYIRFYASSTNQNVYSFAVTSSLATYPAVGSMGRTITFRFSFNFVAGASYYVLLDSGVAVGAEFCNQESLSVTSNSFWSFSTGCPTGYRDSGGTCVDCNECANECTTAICPANSRCANTVGSYTCPCNTGFQLSSGSCRDIDECARGTHQCHPAATCTNTAGSYQCTCPTGSAGNGRTCTDLCDECRNIPAGCGTHNCNVNVADCTNTIGSFQCSCRFGQAADGVTCTPPPRPDPPRSVSITSTGTTTITITWLAPVASLGNRISSYSLVLTETGGASITVSTSAISYTFTGLQEYRTYSCVITAISIYGPVSVATAAVTTTTQQAAPSAPPTNFVAQPSSSRSATISWNPPPTDEINGVIIRYIINVTVVGTGRTFQLTSTTTTLTVTTLTPYTTFICIIAAVTSVGTGPFSAQFTLITPQDAPTAPPQNVVLTPASSTSIGLSWGPPPSSDLNGVVTEYRITITEVITGRVINLVSTTTSITTTGLHPFYAYECVVSAYTVGLGPYSQIFRITTPEDVPSGSPLNFGASMVASRSATITWNPPQADLQNGVIIRYLINVTVVETGQFFQLTSSTTYLTISTLVPFQNYICIIAAVTSVGVGPFSARFTLTTPQDVPTRAPQTPTAVTRDSETIFCSWTPPPSDHHNGIIVEYRIYVTEVATGRVFVRASTTTSLEITSLHPDYVYQWVVTAVTTGPGPYTSTATIRTPESVPSGPPQSPSVSVLSSQSIEINWLPPLLPDQNGAIVGYIIVVTPLNTGISQQLITSVTNTLLVPNLAPFTNYVCIVAARTAIGRGPFSTVITIQTLEDAPGAHPSNFTGSSLNSTHIFLSWDPPPPGQVNGIIREYRLNVTEAVTGSVVQFNTTPTDRQVTVGPLHPYYTYHCSVTAITVQQGPYTAVYVLQTAEDVPSGPPTSFSTSTAGPRSITLSWSPPQPDQQNGILRYYVITLTSALPTILRNVSASLSNITIGGLRPYTPYSCTVRVATIGLGPPTVAQRILTPEDVPNGPPQNLSLVANSSRSLVLAWDVPLPNEVNGIVVDYTINITSSIGTNTIQVGSNTTTFMIGSLRPYIAYTCIIAAHTSVGQGPFSVGVTLTTPEGAPEAPPTSISQSNVMQRSVDLSWASPRSDLQNGVIRYYILEVYENDTGNSSTYQTPSARASYTISNLHPYYTYSIRILAVTVGPGPLSITHTVNTLQDVPTAPPVSPSGSPLTSTLITLRWSPIPREHLNGQLRFYLVDVTEVITNRSWTFHSVRTDINIGPLHAYYTYRCRVAGFTVGLGPYTSLFYVNSGEAYPTGAPANLTAPRTTTTSLFLSWDPPRFDLQNGIIRYYSVFITDITNGSSWELTSNTTRLLVSDLQPFFTYNISVAAFTIGLGPVSDTLIIQLPQAAPSVAPTNIRGLAIDHSSISLTWDALPDILSNGIVSTYIVNVTERETGYTFERNTTGTSIVLDSLHPDYVYECRVAAFTIATGPFSTIFAVQVLMAAPSGPPDNITATPLSSTSMLVTWSPPQQQYRNGPILAYNFTVTEPSTGLVLQSSILMTTSATVYSLRPFTSYNFTLSARTSVGYGPSDTILENTLQDTPSAPTNPQAWSVMGDPYSLYVAWMPPLVTNGYILQYSVYCLESQLMMGSGSGMYFLPTAPSLTFTTTVQGSELNATVSGLQPFTNYGCYVSASTLIGEGNTSATTFQTTDEFVPADPPTSLQVSTINATSVYLSWSPPLTPYGIIVSYTILVELSGGNTTTTITVNAALGTSYTVEELLPYSYYNLSVAASTRIGMGPYSDVNTTMTPQDSPYASPRFPMATVTGTTAANVSWSDPDPTQLNGIVIYYTVVLADQVFGLPDRVYNTTLTSFSFTGLDEYGRYAFQVAAATVAGLGPLSAPITFTTFEAIPVSPPQNVSGSALSSSLIMLFWSPPPPRDVNGAIRYYTVQAVERHTGRQWTFFAVNADFHIGSLHPYYFYDFNVSATTIGRGPFSSTYSILTQPEPPIAAPEQLSTTATTSTSLTISWNPPPFEDTNGPIQYYTVRVTEVDTNTTLPPRNTFTSQITFSNLHPYYVYRCSVAAYTVGIGPYTSPITVQLGQESPAAPALNLVGSPRNSDSIFLSWAPPLVSERNGVIQHYLVNVTETDTGNTYGHVSLTTNFTLFGLHPYYTYAITVTAVTVGPGPPTTPVLVLTNEDVPSGPAEDLNVTVISSEEALLMWQAPNQEDQNGVITGYSINITLVRTVQTILLMSNTDSLFLDDLQPFTTYTFRVAAVTSIGVGPCSIATSFMTDETAPSSPPENLTVSVVSSTSIGLTWTPPLLLARNGIITEYRINVTELDTGSSQILTSFTTSLVAQMLHPYYTYDFSVSAHTVATGPYSNSEIIQTPEDVPSGSPQGFMGTTQSPSSVRFSWTPPRDEDQNGRITAYTINITETGSGTIIQRTVPGARTTITVSPLMPFTTYDVSIVASTTVGIGPFSTLITINTPEYSPVFSPMNLVGSALDSSTIVLGWDVPGPPHNGIIREYRLNITEVETGRVLQEVAATTTLTIGSLHPDYSYEWIVTAFTVGVGPYSASSRVTTPEDVPSGPPTRVAVSALSSTSINISWDLPLLQERNGDIIGYIINITNLDSGITQQFMAGLVADITIPNLRPFTIYVATVSAQTAIGMGPFSNVRSVQTFEDAPGSHPLNSTGYALNSTHIFLDWSPPSLQDVNGIIREYRVNCTEGETNILRQHTTSNSTTEITVGPLHPFYIYHCTILAFTVEGGPNTTIISIRTEEAAPSGPPTTVTARPTSTRSISVTWAPPLRDQQNGILRHYLVTLMSNDGVVTRNVSSIQQIISISGLRPYTLYNCTVQAETVALGPAATAVQVNTPQDIPTGPPQNVMGRAIDSTTLALSWIPPVAERRNGLLQRYIISTTELETGTTAFYNSTTESIVIGGRHPFYRYSYIIAAETIGRGPYSVASMTHMPEAAPSSSPLSVQISAVSASGFLVSWSAPQASDHNGNIRSYIINITEENTGRLQQFTSNTNSLRVESRHPYYNYTCQVSAVTVAAGPYSPPTTITTLEDVPTGSPANLIAMAVSSTSILLTWNPPLVHERNGIITEYTITQVVAGTTSTLTTTDQMLLVMNLRPFTSYTFDIAASTSVGLGPLHSPVAENTPEAAPDGAPDNVVSSNITSTSLTLTWAPPLIPNGIIRHYIIRAVEVNTETNFTYQAQSRTTFTVGDLHPYYTYHFNVHAVTIELGPASLNHTVTTLQDVPTAPPEGISEMATDSRTLLVTWRPPPEPSRNGIITEYVVNITVMETGEQLQHRASGADTTSLSIGSLHPDYTYTYSVAAVTAIGMGPFSAFRSTRLPEDVPTSAPLNPSGRAVNSTAIIFMWDHPPPAGRNGNITGYSLVVTELVTNTTTTYTQSGAHIELVVSFLHPFYEYECVIAAETAVGRGPYGTPFVTRTDPDAPSGLSRNVAAVVVTSRSIHVSWEPPLVDQQNGIIQRYLVMVMVQQTRTSLSLNSTSTSFTIPNLHPAYDYSIEVAAVTNSVGPYTSAISIRTPDDVPTGSPLSVMAATISSTSIRISWQAPLLQLQNGDITSYLISVLELETGDLRNFTTVPTDSIYVINSLHPFYNYNCSVAAYTNALGPSDFDVVQTLPEEPSDSPANVSVIPVNATAVVVSWAPPPEDHRNGIIQGYTIRVVGLHTPEDFTLGISSTETIIGSLHPFYSYKFTVAAVTISHGPFSNPVTVMIPPLAPSQMVNNVTVASLSPTSVRLRWLPPDQDEWNGAISRYTIQYSLLRQVQGEDHDDGDAPPADLNMNFVTYAPSSRQRLLNNPDPRLTVTPLVWEELEISGLQEYFVYSFTMYYENSAGRSDNSDVIEINMPSAAPTGPPINVIVTTPSDTSIAVQWNPPELLERNGPIDSYEVTLIYSNGTRKVYSMAGSMLNFQIEGLPKFPELNITVAARTAAGLGPMSQPLEARFREDVPEAPGSLKASGVDKTSLTLSWAPPTNPNGQIREYQVNYYGYKEEDNALAKRQTADHEVRDGPYDRSVLPDQTTIQIDNLQLGLTYSFTVRARTDPGYGPNSTELTVVIPDDRADVEAAQSGGVGSTGIALIFLGIGWLLLVVIIVLVVAAYFWRRKRKHGGLNIFATGVSNKRYRGGEIVGVHNTNFYEVDGESKTNPAAAGLELNDADYSGVLQNEGAQDSKIPAPGEGLKLAFDEPPPSDDELSRMEAAAEAKRRAIEEDEEDDDNTDEKTKVKVDCREYEDNEIVYL